MVMKHVVALLYEQTVGEVGSRYYLYNITEIKSYNSIK